MLVISQKICLIGDFGVGKTSLIRRFVDRQFSDQYLSTLGVKISRKAVEVTATDVTEPQTAQLMIWDIEGQTKFQSITPTYLQGAKGAIIAADLIRTETLDHVWDHIALISSVNPKGVNLIIALNKSDLLDEENLPTLFQVHQFQEHPQVIATYITSARTGKNVDEIFQKLADSMMH